MTPPKTGSAKEQTGPTKMTHLQQHVLAYEKMMRLNECVIMIMHNCTWARQLFASKLKSKWVSIGTGKSVKSVCYRLMKLYVLQRRKIVS